MTAAGPAAPPARLDLLDGVLQAVKVGVIVFDAEQRVVLWNPWMAQHAQRAPAAVLGKTFSELFPEMAGGRLHAALDDALRNNFAALISQSLNKSPLPLYASPQDAAEGRRIQQALQVMPLAPGGPARHCMVQVSDVSGVVARQIRLRAQASELQAQVYADGLTGIANRRHFDNHLETEFRRTRRAGTPLSLLMIDVDFFKSFNDHYGHQHGDACLTQVAAGLCGAIERPADLLARYGGEEFAAILPDTDAAGAGKVAERMRAAVSALAIAHAHSETADHITISIGLATKTLGQGTTMAHLVDEADSALYQAKRAGRNRVVAHPGPA